MLCDRCGDREATIHDVSIVKGEVRETHLCERCAEELQAGQAKNATLGEWLAGLGMMVADAPKFPAPPKPGRAPACPTCGMRFLDLRKTGLVGCQDCYETFETRLTPLLRKAHDGGARHTGKHPALTSKREVIRVNDAAEPAAREHDSERTPETVEERIEALTHQLALAIEAENYERAAQIRDELADLTGDGGLGGFGASGNEPGGSGA